MYYYQHHIGDYRRDTSHLTLLEHGAYRQLLDLYYISEKPLDANALRLVCARDADEIKAVEQILSEFFVLQNGKYYHKRCEDEIARYHNKSNKAKESAKIRWNKNNNLQDANALQTDSERNANHKPLTNNHKPNKYTPPIPAELLTEWMQHRKKKPVTERVIKTIEIEANKLGWSLQQAIECSCANSWQGFKAEWVNKNQSNKNDKSSVVNAAFGNLLKQYEANEKDITNESITF